MSYVGYQPYYDSFQLSANHPLSVELSPSALLKEVVVRDERPTDAKSSQMSAITIPVESIKSVPVLFGEADVMKAVQLMPGVQSGTEGSSGMYVRGGGPDENLFLLDGVPLYNVNHLGGFFSAFNSDAIKNVTLYKGSFPAHFGGRLSSVLDITTNNGNDQQVHGGASIGLISAKVFAEGPIVKDKTTFSVSARRTYLDFVAQPIIKYYTRRRGVKTTAGYYFYDLNGKVTHKFSDRSRLFLSYYMGDDKVYGHIKTGEMTTDLPDGSSYTDRTFLDMDYKWGNIVASARWNYMLGPKLFMNVTGAYTRYSNVFTMGFQTERDFGASVDEANVEMTYKSGINDYTARVDFDFMPNPDHNVKFGTNYIHHVFQPEVAGVNYQGGSSTAAGGPSSIDTTVGGELFRADEVNLYVEDDWSVSEKVKVNGGVAMSGFAVEGTFYPSVQPRLSGRVMLADDLSLKMGYAYTTQYLHLLSNSTVSMPTDLWVPVTARIAPMNAHQVATGLFYKLKDWCDLSVEGYYKYMDNLTEYKDGASFFSGSTNWEDKVCLGEGWAYGLEFLAQRTVGKFTGWIGYTWSKSERLFDREGETLNGGEPFPAKYDRRHDVSIVLMYKWSDRFDASLSWVYNTGNVTTLSLEDYESAEGGSVSFFESRNNYRLPNYHRLDASVNFHRNFKKGSRTINVSVYNLYNRKNPYMIYESADYHYTYAGQTYRSALVQMSLFPIIPSVSYVYKF